jgi:hypothetical protein
MSLRRNSITMFAIARPDEEAVLSLTIENVMRAVTSEKIELQPLDQQELRTLITENEMFRSFALIVESMNRIDKSRASGAGLSQSEKNHYNELQDSSEQSRPTQDDSLSQAKVKIKKIRDNTRDVVKYKNIISLYTAYYKALNDGTLWNDRLTEVKNEWLLHRHFAMCDSVDLTRIYKSYQEFDTNLNEFRRIIQADRIKTRTNVKTALLLYFKNLSSQVARIKSQAIYSMMLRLQSADRRCDIHYDDVMHDTVEKVEREIGKRIIREQENRREVFAQLRVRRRRGMSYDDIRMFIGCIQEYCKPDSRDNELDTHDKKVILGKLNSLSMMTLESGPLVHIHMAFQLDPVILFVINRSDDVRRKVAEKLLLEPDSALILVDDLGEMLAEARSRYQRMLKTSSKSRNITLEERLEFSQRDFVFLVNSTYQSLSEQVKFESQKAIRDCLAGEFRGIAELHASIKRLREFHTHYRFMLEGRDPSLQADFVFYVLRYIDDHRDELSSSINRDRLATLIAINHYWPITDNNRHEFESSRLALSNRLASLHEHFKHSFFHHPYIHYNWMISFVEEALTLTDLPLVRHQAMGREYKHSWSEYFPYKEEALDTGITVPVPDIVAQDLDQSVRNLKTSNRRAFVLANMKLIREISSAGTFVANVIIPYVSVSPFINLFNINRNVRYVRLMDHLRTLLQELNKNIETVVTTPKMPKKTVNMLVRLRQFYNEQFERIDQEWQKHLSKNIDMATTEHDLVEYLRNDNDIDLRKLKALLHKIADIFTDHRCRQMLTGKLQIVCARILVEIGMQVLTSDHDSINFTLYIQLLNQMSGIREFGSSVIHKVTSNLNISRLLIRHLEQFDGSRPVIGGLIASLFPMETLANNDAAKKYIIPYARKRLEYLESVNGEGIQLGDVMFFDVYAAIPECAELFVSTSEEFRGRIQEAISDNQAPWNPVTARIIELFGDSKSINLYRARAIVSLMTIDDVKATDIEMTDVFIQSLLRPGEHVVDPHLRVTDNNVQFEIFLWHIIDNSLWTVVREKLISVLGQDLLQQYHTRSLYKFLNDRAPGFGLWMEQQLKNVHPDDFFGDMEVGKISTYVMRLMDQVEFACHDFNVDGDQGESIMNLLNNLKRMQAFFHQIGSNVGVKFLADVGNIERGIKLAVIIRKTLVFFTQSEGVVTFNIESIYKLLSQLLISFAEVERNEMVSSVNISAYLDFIEKANASVPCSNLASLQDKHLAGIFNYHLTLIEHLKKLVLKIASSSLIDDTAPKMLLSLVNCLDNNDKISEREANILEGLDQSPELRSVVIKLISFAREINLTRHNINQEFQARLLKEAQIKAINDNPGLLAIVCVRRLVQVDMQTHLSSAYIGHLIQTIHNVMNMIPCGQFADFSGCFIDAMSTVTKLAQLSTQNDLTPLMLFNMLGGGHASRSHVNKNTLLQPLLTDFHAKFVSHAVFAHAAEYVVSKMELKSVNKRIVFHEVSVALSRLDENEQLGYVKLNLGIKHDHNARKAIFLVNFYNVAMKVFDGKARMDSLVECISAIKFEIQERESKGQHDYYKAKKIKDLLEFILNLVKTPSIQDALLLCSNSKQFKGLYK